MAGIFIEEPPTDNVILKEWVVRMLITISMELEKGSDLEPVGQVPDHIQDGMVRYFNAAIAPDIASEGVWVVIAGTWTKMA